MQFEEEGRARLERRVGLQSGELKYSVTLTTAEGKKVRMVVHRDGKVQLHSHYAHHPLVDNCVKDLMFERAHLWVPIDLAKICSVHEGQGFIVGSIE